jgi:hypothetical protein
MESMVVVPGRALVRRQTELPGERKRFDPLLKQWVINPALACAWGHRPGSAPRMRYKWSHEMVF